MDAPLPQTQTVILPFVQITVLETGQIQTQSNLAPDLAALLCEKAKLQMLLTKPDAPKLHKPSDGFASDMLRKMRP